MFALPVCGARVALKLPDGADDLRLVEARGEATEVALTLIDALSQGAIDTRQLVVTDFEWLLMQMRAERFGRKVALGFACPHCAARAEIEFRVDDCLEAATPQRLADNRAMRRFRTKQGVAVFIDPLTHDAVRLRTGERHLGWILQSVDRRTATLQKSGQTETLELPRPANLAGPSPVVTTLPPPAPIPPQIFAPGRRPAPRMPTRAVWLSNAYGIAFAWRSRVGGFTTGR